jgi:hypothetical protein
MFIKHKILSIEIPDIPQLFVATCFKGLVKPLPSKDFNSRGCNTKRCLCKQSGLLCNSRCHPNITCSHK